MGTLAILAQLPGQGRVFAYLIYLVAGLVAIGLVVCFIRYAAPAFDPPKPFLTGFWLLAGGVLVILAIFFLWSVVSGIR